MVAKLHGMKARFTAFWAVFLSNWAVEMENVRQSSGFFGRLMRSQNGSVGAIVTAIIGIVVALYVLANLAPGALEALMDVDTSGWDSSVAGIWSVLIILVVVALLYMIWKFVERQRT